MGNVAVLLSGNTLLWAGGAASGITGVQAPQFSSGQIAGPISSGSFVGIAFNTGRVLGRALTSGGIGSGIQMYVCLE
jgi:hypothetical protein